MAKKLLTLLIFSFLLIIPLISAQLDVGFDEEGSPLVEIIPATPPVNYSTVNVNNSQFLQGYTPTTLRNFFQITYDTLYQTIGNYVTSLDNVAWVNESNVFTEINHFSSNVSFADNITVGADVLYVDSSSGSVGIGTSSPSAFLPMLTIRQAIDGTNRGIIIQDVLGRDAIEMGQFQGKSWIKNRRGDASRLIFGTGAGSYTQTLVMLSGKVGIMTDSPDANLDVVDDFMVSSVKGAQGDLFTVLSTGNVGIGTTTPSSLLDVKGNMSVNNTLYVTENGNVGIGTSSPVYALEVVGNIGIDNGNGIYMKDSGGDYFESLTTFGDSLYVGRATGWHLSDLYLRGGDGDVIIDVGNLGIGTTSPTHKLNVVGDANVTGNLTIEDSLLVDYIYPFLNDVVQIFNLSVLNDLRVFGNGYFIGNVTAENVFLPQYIFSHTNATIPLLGASTWTNITFDQENADIKMGISHNGMDDTNHTFMVMEDGIYNVDYDFDIEDNSGTPSDIDVAGRIILTNGTEVIGSVFETDITKQGVSGELSHNFLVECRAGEEFVFQFVADDADVRISTHGTFGVHPESATIVMYKIANLP